MKQSNLLKLVGLGGVISLLGLAYWWNGWTGFFSALGWTYSSFLTLITYLYAKNPGFYFWIKKFTFIFSRSHTFWDVSLRFCINEPRADVLDKLVDTLNTSSVGKVRVHKVAPNVLNLVLLSGGPIAFTISLDENDLYIGTDLALLVPANLAERYQYRLRQFAEVVLSVVGPVQTFCGITVGFDGEAKNPYYGLFVERVPKELVQDFNVAFRIDRHSDCSVVADNQGVRVQAMNLNDLFNGVSRVISLSAVPVGVES